MNAWNEKKFHLLNIKSDSELTQIGGARITLCLELGDLYFQPGTHWLNDFLQFV